MAQVTQAAILPSMREATIAYGIDGTTFATDLSGHACSIAPSGGERETGEAYTFTGDTALVGYGKRPPTDYTIRVLYTEVNTDPFQVIRAAYENATACYLRVSPKGGQAGEWLWTSSQGIFSLVPEPAGEANSGDPVAVEATFRCAYWTKTNAAS